MSFDQAVHFVQQNPGKAAFVAVPVFGDQIEDEETRAEGARVFIVEADGAGSWRLRFVAGPFFSNAFAANETLDSGEAPESVRELRFLPARLDEAWLAEQVQILIQRLMQSSGQVAEEMPDYLSMPARAADADVVFPVSFIERKPH